MGTIMRGDQTLRLIQLYYNNYPDIARNTQDADGRKARAQMWTQITDELNTSYDTNFSVEQYKKKIQNVQCTSRQKIQAGKRNLGVAEFEYLRLFEQERLSTNTTSTSDTYESMTRSSSTDLTTNVRIDQMLEKFGIDPQVFQPGSLLNGHDNQTFEAGSPSDSDSNTTANPSFVDNIVPLSKSPPSFGPLASLSTQMDPRQLMFALTQFNQELRNADVLNTLATNQLSSSFVHSKTVASPPATTHELNDKEKQCPRSPPTIKRPPQEDNENLMRMFSPKKKRMNGIFGNQNVDDKWKREMLELQQRILDNQGKILEHMDSKNQQPIIDLSSIDSKLEKLCDSITLLNHTLKEGLFHKKTQTLDDTS